MSQLTTGFRPGFPPFLDRQCALISITFRWLLDLFFNHLFAISISPGCHRFALELSRFRSAYSEHFNVYPGPKYISTISNLYPCHPALYSDVHAGDSIGPGTTIITEISLSFTQILDGRNTNQSSAIKQSRDGAGSCRGSIQWQVQCKLIAFFCHPPWL